jgi:predicted GNAT superfamily acetyltransferase
MKGRRSTAPILRAEPLQAIAVRRCQGLAEFAACMEVERVVWGSADVDIVPLPIFVVAAETGGQVLGAFDGDRVIGFTLAVAGVRGRKPFLHSHMTAVLTAYRNRGIGHRLKLFQRDDALSRGIDLVEWSFDPLEVRNAQFNFSLGAIARRYLPNLYGVTTSPLHGGLPTDRLIAEWQLRSPRLRSWLSARRPPRATSARGGRKIVEIRVPPELAEVKQTKPEEAARLQGEIRLEFEHWFGRGYAATGIAVRDAGGTYRLEPWTKE